MVLKVRHLSSIELWNEWLTYDGIFLVFDIRRRFHLNKSCFSFYDHFINILIYLAREDIQRSAAVQYILDSLVIALDENPDRRFIYVEIAFFWRWWVEQTEEIRDKVVGFVNDGKVSQFIFDIVIIFTTWHF